MKLIGLIKNIPYTLIQGNVEVNIKNITNDSRKVEKDSLFVCIDGFESDGHDYVSQAIEKGAAALIVTKDVMVNSEITVIRVENARKALALASGKFYDYPSKKFALIGITGTNGKTSTVFLLDAILRKANKKTGIIGTIENRIIDTVVSTERTTPESVELQELFAKMVEHNVNKVIMEVSSHALDLDRVAGSYFDIGVFTNLSLDHLEYHKTMENYRDAKKKLFEMCKTGVINIDDQAGRYILENSSCEAYITYGCENDQATLNATNIINKITGTIFEVEINGRKETIELQTPGKFSVYNALAAIATAIALKIPVDTIIEALKYNSRVRGRFETIESPEGYYAIVDYAHTPDGLENVLNTIRSFAEKRVITVFGCGGDRDRSKRPEMGRIAGEMSDFAIITSDNPRTEDPESILKEIEVGISPLKGEYIMIADREEAINKALSMAQNKDIVLIAGKGHEDYQIIGKTKIHFDDAEKVKEYINKTN